MAEEIITTAGPFKFINRTKYNSEDIAALFNLYRAAIKREVGNPNEEPSRSHYGPPVDVFEFSDYNPAKVFAKRHAWDSATNRSVSVTRPEYVSGPGYSASTSWKIGLVPPDRLYESELERLTAAESGSAPGELSVQLLNKLVDMFSEFKAPHQTMKDIRDWLRLEAKNLPIRIMPKRENPASTADRRMRVKRTRAANCVTALTYEGQSAAAHVHTFRNTMARGMADFKAIDVPPPFTVAEIEEVYSKIEDLNRRIAEYKKDLLA